jgi:prephenate dehydrogenase
MKVALLGTGLIGGSIGLALGRLPDIEEVVAYDVDPRVRDLAVARGAANWAADDPETAAAGADIVFVAAPVGAIPELVSAAASSARPGAVITDVGSTKSRLVIEVEKSLPDRVTFIGGHPMAGTEEEGIEASDAALLDGCWWILTPTQRVDAVSYQALHALLGRFGARVMALDADKHDDLMAIVSHLPHLIATTLMNLAAERGRDHAGLLSLAAGGFRDVTRVAASNPDIWLDICEENREAIGSVLDEFAGRVLELGELVKAGKRSELRERFLSARAARRNLPGKGLAGDVIELHILVPDRPGVLAEVTTTVGDLGVNIEDLQITHAEESGRGTLRIIVVGKDVAEQVRGALSSRGYDVRSLSL